jgi:hypothetical protein
MRELCDTVSRIQKGEYVQREEYNSMLTEIHTSFGDQQGMINELHNNIVTLSGGEVPHDPDAP